MTKLGKEGREAQCKAPVSARKRWVLSKFKVEPGEFMVKGEVQSIQMCQARGGAKHRAKWPWWSDGFVMD